MIRAGLFESYSSCVSFTFVYDVFIHTEARINKYNGLFLGGFPATPTGGGSAGKKTSLQSFTALVNHFNARYAPSNVFASHPMTLL